MPSKLQRWLDVVAYLAGRRLPVSSEELWRNVPAYASALEDGESRKGSRQERMFERDKKELRALGIPIETVTYRINYGTEESHGYRLERSDFHLPYLRLLREAEDRASSTPPPGADVFTLRMDEATSVLDRLHEVAELPGFPLAEEARSAYRKLSFDLEPAGVERTPIHVVPDPEARVASDDLRRLSDALIRRKRVRARYHSMGRDQTGVRTLEPYGLLFQHGRWYLVARDPDVSGGPAVRMFRVHRLEAMDVVEGPGSEPDYAIPRDFDLGSYGGRKAWELGSEGGSEGDGDGTAPQSAAPTATVRFDFPRSLWAERNGHGTLDRTLEDGAQLRRFTVHRADPFLRWILSLGGEARVEDPPELREALREMAARVRDRYGPEDA